MSSKEHFSNSPTTILHTTLVSVNALPAQDEKIRATQTSKVKQHDGNQNGGLLESHSQLAITITTFKQSYTTHMIINKYTSQNKNIW